jgi:hypothetical protein
LKVKRPIVLAPDGQRLVVIRPSTPAGVEKALELASISVEKNSETIFQSIPGEVSDYIFKGYLGRHPKSLKLSIVDVVGNWLEELAPGDSFVGEDDVASAEGSLSSSPVSSPSTD